MNSTSSAPRSKYAILASAVKLKHMKYFIEYGTGLASSRPVLSKLSSLKSMVFHVPKVLRAVDATQSELITAAVRAANKQTNVTNQDRKRAKSFADYVNRLKILGARASSVPTLCGKFEYTDGDFEEQAANPSLLVSANGVMQIEQGVKLVETAGEFLVTSHDGSITDPDICEEDDFAAFEMQLIEKMEMDTPECLNHKTVEFSRLEQNCTRAVVQGQTGLIHNSETPKSAASNQSSTNTSLSEDPGLHLEICVANVDTLTADQGKIVEVLQRSSGDPESVEISRPSPTMKIISDSSHFETESSLLENCKSAREFHCFESLHKASDFMTAATNSPPSFPPILGKRRAQIEASAHLPKRFTLSSVCNADNLFTPIDLSSSIASVDEMVHFESPSAPVFAAPIAIDNGKGRTNFESPIISFISCRKLSIGVRAVPLIPSHIVKRKKGVQFLMPQQNDLQHVQGKVYQPVRVVRNKQPCKFYLTSICRKGDACPFSHEGIPDRKFELCSFFLQDKCIRGTSCPFTHGLNFTFF